MNNEETVLETAEEILPAVRRILVPTDFSLPAQRALSHALRLAKETGAELNVIHVSESLPAPYGCSAHEYLLEQQHAREKVSGEVEALVNKLSGGPFPGSLRIIAMEGVPSQEIVRVAQEKDTDLIIIATHGRTGFKRFVLGSTADKVVRFAPCSVLVIRKKQESGALVSHDHPSPEG